MQVKTTRFGVLEIDPQKIIQFPRGMPGFEQLREFFVLPVPGIEELHWLQSAQEPELAFLVADPFKFFPGYHCTLSPADIEEMELTKPEDALVLTVITLPSVNPRAATANLVAPVVINTANRRGKQVIFSGSSYTTKHLLLPDGEGQPPKEPDGDQGGG